MKLTVETVKVVKGIGPADFQYSRPSHNSLVENSWIYRALLVNGTLEDGRQVYFFSPSAEILTGSGFVNYEELKTNGKGFFKQVKGKVEGHENSLHYKGSSTPAASINDTSEIVPTIEEGDEIEISFRVKRQAKNGKYQLNYVRNEE